MSGSKRGSGADEIYSTHLFGAHMRYANNPNINRERMIYAEHMRNIGELAINRFEWKGLPESVDPRFLELSLYYTGLCVFYWDKDYDKHLAVRGTGTGYVNMLDNPVSFTVVGPGTMNAAQPSGEMNVTGMLSKTLSAYDPVRHDPKDEESKMKCIPIWGNSMRFPMLNTIMIYAQRLAWMDRTIEINTRNARRTKVVRGTPNTQLSKMNVARSFDQGDELIVVTDTMAVETDITTLDLGIDPDSYEKLSILRTRTWNELMGLLGIDNANQDKKERLVQAEVGANDSQTDSMRYVSLNARQHAADQINAVFGLNVTVDYRAEIEAREDAVTQASLTAKPTVEKEDDNG